MSENTGRDMTLMYEASKQLYEGMVMNHLESHVKLWQMIVQIQTI